MAYIGVGTSRFGLYQKRVPHNILCGFWRALCIFRTSISKALRDRNFGEYHYFDFNMKITSVMTN